MGAGTDGRMRDFRTVASPPAGADAPDRTERPLPLPTYCAITSSDRHTCAWLPTSRRVMPRLCVTPPMV